MPASTNWGGKLQDGIYVSNEWTISMFEKKLGFETAEQSSRTVAIAAAFAIAFKFI